MQFDERIARMPSQISHGRHSQFNPVMVKSRQVEKGHHIDGDAPSRRNAHLLLRHAGRQELALQACKIYALPCFFLQKKVLPTAEC